MIAPYWADSDTYFAFRRHNYKRYDDTDIKVDPLKWSTVYYNAYKEGDGGAADAVLANATRDVKNKFSGLDDFEATWVFVVTWVNVYPYIEWDPPQEDLYFPYVSSTRL